MGGLSSIRAALSKKMTGFLGGTGPRGVSVHDGFGRGMKNVGYTLEEVGQRFSVTRERIRQIRKHTLFVDN
jgi:hypothetical protein